MTGSSKQPTDQPTHPIAILQDNIEAACEMISIAGKQLSSSDEKKTRDAIDALMARLQKFGEAKDVSSRIRFVVKDVIDMRKNKW